MRKLVKLCKGRKKAEREREERWQINRWFKPLWYIFYSCLPLSICSSLIYLFCAAHIHTLCHGMSYLLSAQIRSLSLNSISVPFLSLSTSCYNTSTCIEVAAESNNSAYLHFNVMSNCVGCYQCWYIQQLSAACECVCVCHSWGSEVLKVNAAIFFSLLFWLF